MAGTPEETKDEEVLEREGLEQELMQRDASEVGEDLDGVDDPERSRD